MGHILLKNKFFFNHVLSTISVCFIVLILAGGAAFAQPSSETLKRVLEAQTSCGTFVRYDDQNIYLGFGQYQTFIWPRTQVPGKVRIVPLDGSPSRELATHDGAADIVTVNGHAFILTYSAIEEWDLATNTRVGEYATYETPDAFDFEQAPAAFARYGNTLIIAHGRLGVSFFDLGTKRITRQYHVLGFQLPLESMVTAVSIQGNLAYLAVDDFTLVPDGDPLPFQGVIMINMDTQAVVNELGGMTGAAQSILTDAKDVLIQFTGQLMWRFDRAALGGSKTPDPLKRIWVWPVDGHPAHGSFPAMDDKYIYTCYAFTPSSPSDNNGFYRFKPLALNRAQLLLK
jgi:hypothetical protein